MVQNAESLKRESGRTSRKEKEEFWVIMKGREMYKVQ